MLVRKLKDCQELTAADNTALRELLHPERSYQFNGRYSLAQASLPPGQKSLSHRLNGDEVYYVIAGRGLMHINGEDVAVEAGDAIDIPPQATQWIENTGSEELVFLCIVDPAWRPEDEKITE